MHEFGRECDDPKDTERWLREAAEEGHVQAMYELGLGFDDPDERRMWLEQAAR